MTGIKHTKVSIIADDPNYDILPSDWNAEHTIEGAITGTPNGWIDPDQIWAYASATTITVPSGAASIYSVGDTIMLTQTTVKYFYVVGVADTTLTITGGTTYTLVNADITSPYYSKAVSPVGFPTYFNYTTTTGGITLGSGTLVSRFSISQNIITADIALTLAADSSITGSVSFTLPYTPSISFTIPVWLRDAGTTTYFGFGLVYAGNATFTVYAANAGGTYTSLTALSSTIPHTWATGDNIYISATYRK